MITRISSWLFAAALFAVAPLAHAQQTVPTIDGGDGGRLDRPGDRTSDRRDLRKDLRDRRADRRDLRQDRRDLRSDRRDLRKDRRGN